jgi:hypothetical protein
MGTTTYTHIHTHTHIHTQIGLEWLDNPPLSMSPTIEEEEVSAQIARFVVCLCVNMGVVYACVVCRCMRSWLCMCAYVCVVEWGWGEALMRFSMLSRGRNVAYKHRSVSFAGYTQAA